jgi:F-type H+-transporting ATPase subunit b
LIFHKLISRRVSHLILSIAMLLGVAGMPALSMAQAADTSAAPQSEPKARSGSASVFKEEHKAEKKTEAEETQEYRHSPTVQALAKLLHLDVETAAKVFEYINFAVILLAVGIPLSKMLPKAMRKRSAKLSFDLELAQAKTADSNDRLKVVEEKLAGLDAEINAIRKQVEDDMREDEARSKAQIAEETARIVKAAENEIAVAATQAQRGLKQFAADLAIDRAMSQLTVDAETDRALFAEFALDVAGKKGSRRHPAKGDQN